MPESGLVRAKNATEIFTKSIVLYCVMYLLLMYGGATQSGRAARR